MCSFLQACYLQITTVIKLNQLKSGNELSRCFGASVEVKELQGRFGVWLINQLHLWDSKGLPKELRGALQERGELIKSSLWYLTPSKSTTNSSQSGTVQDYTSSHVILCFDFLCSIQSQEQIKACLQQFHLTPSTSPCRTWQTTWHHAPEDIKARSGFSESLPGFEYLQGWIHYKLFELQAQHVIYLCVKTASLYQGGFSSLPVCAHCLPFGPLVPSMTSLK